MKNDSSLPDADAEQEELLQALESAHQELQSSSQLVAQLTRRLNETAMARVEGHRRIDLRALRSLDLKPGKYEINMSEPDDPQPMVTLTWLPGSLILGVELKQTDRDVTLPLPTVRETLSWSIPLPPPNTIPPPLSPEQPRPQSEAERMAKDQQYHAWRRAVEAYYQTQTQAAQRQATTDQPRASRDEEAVAEAMMAEIEARRADPQAHAGRTIMDVGQAAADQFLLASRNSLV